MGRAYIAYSIEFPHYFDAETRFQAGRKLGEDRPCEVACAEAVDKVHNVLVETIRLGLADGSVRSDIGDPEVVSVALWAFSHGLVQIVTAKEQALAARGIAVAQVTEESIRMLQYMLAARPPN